MEGGFLLSLVITWQYWRANSRSITIVWGTMTALIGYSLLVSGSRGSWIGLAAALGLWGLLLVSNRTLRLTVIGIGGVVTLVGIYILFCRFSVVQQLPGLASTLQTFHSRFVLYRNSFYLLEDYFITGIGLGDVFALVYSRYQLLIPVPFLTYAHNMFLSIGLSLGVLGLMAFSWLLLSFYRFVVQSERAGISPQLSPLFRGSWLGVSVIFVHGLFDSAQFASSAWTMPMLFALLGLSVKIGNPALLAVSEERASGRSLRGKSRWVRLIPVGFVILLAAAGIIFRDSLLSVWYTNIGAVYQTRADLAPDIDAFDRQTARLQAADNFEHALEWNPDNPAANRRSGLLALEHGDFYAAIRSLERAHQSELQDQATLKALGLAYLWAGRLDSAEVLLRQLDPPGNLPNQLAGWRWWWRTRERADLSAYADEMLKRLYPAR